MNFLAIVSKKVILLFLFLAIFVAYKPDNVHANVGLIEVRSTTSEDYRCFASSLIMPDRTYNVAVNCANLIYPPQPPEIAAYVLWASPVSGKTAIKLGDLGKGEARFQVKQAFNSLYVTIEPNANVRTPGKNIIMTGGIEPITFLRRPTSPTPTIEPSKNTSLTPGSTDVTTDTSKLSTKDKLLLALRRAGVAAVIALITIIGLVFVVTRSRG